MSFDFHDLDDRTRELMLKEVEDDLASGTLFLSGRLNPHGKAQWPDLLKWACQVGDEAALALELGRTGGTMIQPEEVSHRVDGTPFLRRVPGNAAVVLAEGEFNRFYIRALCIRAIADGVDLEIYRARYSANPASTRRLGEFVDPVAVLKDLRSRPGVELALALPPHPNSGISVKLVT